MQGSKYFKGSWPVTKIELKPIASNSLLAYIPKEHVPNCGGAFQKKSFGAKIKHVGRTINYIINKDRVDFKKLIINGMTLDAFFQAITLR